MVTNTCSLPHAYGIYNKVHCDYTDFCSNLIKICYISGVHSLNVTIHGTGLVANLIRSMVKDLNVQQSINVVHSNATCLPKPSNLSSYFYIKVFGTYFVVWLLILTDIYTGRLNRLICAHFYPKVSRYGNTQVDFIMGPHFNRGKCTNKAKLS